MRTKMMGGVVAFGIASMLCHIAQGQQWVTNPGGNNWLAPTAGFPIVYNATVGTAASNFATLRVRGDQLSVNSFWPAFGGGASVCTFRTDVGDDTNQNWDMVRGADHIGRLWRTGRRTVENSTRHWAEKSSEREA